MSIVHSCEETQTANRVSGGSPPSGSSFQAASPATAAPPAQPRGDRAARRFDALRLEQRGDEVPEHDPVAVGDEVGLPRTPVSRAGEQALDDVVDVGGVRELPPAADPRELALLDHRGDRRQQRRVAASPDEPRAQDDGSEPARGGGMHGALGERLGRAVQSLRIGAQRRRLVDHVKRPACDQRRLGAAVDEAADAGLAAGGERVLGPGDVVADEVLAPAPGPEVGCEVECRRAVAGAGSDRGAVGEVATNRLGAAGLDGCSRFVGASQGPHPAPLAVSRSISRPPMKPEPPVTKMRSPGRRSRSTSLDERSRGLSTGGPGRDGLRRRVLVNQGGQV